MKWTINGVSDLERIAQEFVALMGDHKHFALYGPMGVGKTTFVKAIAKALGSEDDVNSPTFAIVNEYLLGNQDTMYHFDFYRVKNSDEALDFGYEDYIYSDRLCFMEWPELISDILPDDIVACRFTENPDSTRTLEVAI